MDFEDHQNDLAADLSAAIANDLASGILIPDDPLDEEVSSYNLSDVSTYNLSDVSTYNLSDVLDVIQHQQEQEVITLEGVNSMFPTNNGDAGAGPSAQAQQQNQQQHQFRQPAERTPSNSSSHRSHSKRQQAYVEILEQPAPKSLRFRYECEGRSAGSIPGVRNTPETKTYPSIRVVGYKGDAFVVVSCVTKDFPYKPHPHNLVGKDCKTGVCTVRITDESMTITFSNLGIQCVKKKDVEQHLKQREEIKVDPFKTGFSHRNQPSSIDLNAVRLCFQVFVNGPNGLTALQPVVSEPIFDKKAMSELVICKLSDCSSPITGGKDIILLCEKVAKEDIAVRFYEEKEGQVVWEANGEFQHSNVHKQVAISFRTPAYRSLDISHMVKVFIQLKRPSDGCVSDPLPFDYLPLDSGRLRTKRPRIENREHLYGHIQDHEQQQQQSEGRQLVQQNVPGGFLNIPNQPIKQEPRDNSPANFNLFGGYRVQQGTPSPQPPSPLNMFNQGGPNPNNPMIGSPYRSPHQLQMTSPTPGQGGDFLSPLMGGITPTNDQNMFEGAYQQRTPQKQTNFMNFPATNTQMNQQNQQQQNWNIPTNDLSTSGAPFLQHIASPLVSNAPVTVPASGANTNYQLNIVQNSNSMSNYIDLGDNHDLGQLNTGDLLPDGQTNRLDQDQDNMTDSLTRLRLEMINDFEQNMKDMENT